MEVANRNSLMWNFYEAFPFKRFYTFSSCSSRSWRPRGQMYGIQLTSPEPFVVEYPRNSPIHAVMPRSVSPKSPIYRRSPPIVRRSPSPLYRRDSPRFMRRSPSLRCKSPSSLHRSLSIGGRSRHLRMHHRPFRSRSYADYAFEEEEEELVGRGGGRCVRIVSDWPFNWIGFKIWPLLGISTWTRTT